MKIRSTGSMLDVVIFVCLYAKLFTACPRFVKLGSIGCAVLATFLLW